MTYKVLKQKVDRCACGRRTAMFGRWCPECWSALVELAGPRCATCGKQDAIPGRQLCPDCLDFYAPDEARDVRHG